MTSNRLSATIPVSLAFSNISAKAADGTITRKFRNAACRKSIHPSPRTVQFHDLQADKLLTNAGGPAGMIQGRVEGSLEATGKTAESNALTGHGEIVPP